MGSLSEMPSVYSAIRELREVRDAAEMAYREAAGARLRTKRTQSGLSAQRLANELGIDLSKYNDLEAGRSSPTMQSYVRLASLLSCQPGDLLPRLDEVAYIDPQEQREREDQQRREHYAQRRDLLRRRMPQG